jgi:hypothetical protein
MAKMNENHNIIMEKYMDHIDMDTIISQKM